MAAYTTGYEDERFEQTVSQTLHCIICTNVIKDAVTCPVNEHLFCRVCIITHLKISQKCPTCMEPLTVDTLKEAPRSIRNLLYELKIRCEFYDRGCKMFVELGDLEKHVAECQFAPAICSNEGCGREVNKRDLLHHETAVCEQRRVKCHSCDEIRKAMNDVQINLKAIKEKLDKNEKKLERVEERIIELDEEQRTNSKGSIDQIRAGNLATQMGFDEIKNLLKKITPPQTQETSNQVEIKQKGEKIDLTSDETSEDEDTSAKSKSSTKGRLTNNETNHCKTLTFTESETTSSDCEPSPPQRRPKEESNKVDTKWKPRSVLKSKQKNRKC